MWKSEDHEIFLKYCNVPRDRCWHAMANDTSARPHELLNLKIKDVVFKKSNNGIQYAEIHVSGKTTSRTLPLIRSIPYVRLRVINVPANPRDYTYNECLYILEFTKRPITFEELIKAACKRNEYIQLYIGDDVKMRNNTKMRSILELLLNHSCVKRIQLKPTVLEWVGRDREEITQESSIIVNN